MKIHIIIGKNYGDEGKGLAVDYFAKKAKMRGDSVLVVRHNGGAQAGHTVDRRNGRFIFHQLSSGSFLGADTLWAKTFLPDLYKIEEERQEFRESFGISPNIFTEGDCRLVLIDDVLVNMAAETVRGKKRHGSCGMGINEAVNRCEDRSYAVYLKDILGQTAEETALRMRDIRKNYLPLRLNKLGLSLSEAGEYGELLQEDSILLTVAEQMHRAAENIRLVDFSSERRADREYYVRSHYGEVIFEGAQGLLLDNDRREFYPHTTPSKTGCKNPMDFCKAYLPGEEPEIVYVTRSYVTRHGNGPLPFEIVDELFTKQIVDHTNIPNDWQGSLRFGCHERGEAFFKYIKEDLAGIDIPYTCSLMVTHLNETEGRLLFEENPMEIADFVEEMQAKEMFSHIYLSDTRFAEDIK